jgi:hypothetical protein
VQSAKDSPELKTRPSRLHPTIRVRRRRFHYRLDAKSGDDDWVHGRPFPQLDDCPKRTSKATTRQAGRKLVLTLERVRLARSGRLNLTDAARWAFRLGRDGAGLDTRGYLPDGHERLIDAKTTELGTRTPFCITRWGPEVSNWQPKSYPCYYAHGFRRDPRTHVLGGSVENPASLGTQGPCRNPSPVRAERTDDG